MRGQRIAQLCDLSRLLRVIPLGKPRDTGEERKNALSLAGFEPQVSGSGVR